jgi:hypothetical protein
MNTREEALREMLRRRIAGGLIFVWFLLMAITAAEVLEIVWPIRAVFLAAFGWIVYEGFRKEPPVKLPKKKIIKARKSPKKKGRRK